MERRHLGVIPHRQLCLLDITLEVANGQKTKSRITGIKPNTGIIILILVTFVSLRHISTHDLEEERF